MNYVSQKHMTLGTFSLSLNVKDLSTSKAFYESLGFDVFDGDMEMNYLIMKQGDTLIGLFQGMFDKNILTFNPGWDTNAQQLDSFDDIRDIQSSLKKQGIDIQTEVDPESIGPASMMIQDPDGNMILIDQHV